MLAAALMVYGQEQLPYLKGCYSNKTWLGSVPTALQRKEIKAFGNIISRQQQPAAGTVLEDRDINECQDSYSVKGYWHVYFSHWPCSNEELRALVPDALRALDTYDSSHEWELPTDMPGPVLEWFQGKKEIPFASISDSSFNDIVTKILGVLSTNPNRLSTCSLQQVIRQILTKQQAHLSEIRGRYQDFWHSRF